MSSLSSDEGENKIDDSSREMINRRTYFAKRLQCYESQSLYDCTLRVGSDSTYCKVCFTLFLCTALNIENAILWVEKHPSLIYF